MELECRSSRRTKSLRRRASLVAQGRATPFNRGELPQRRQQRRQRPAPMRHRILLLRAQLRGRPRRARRQEHRVVAEAAVARAARRTMLPGHTPRTTYLASAPTPTHTPTRTLRRAARRARRPSAPAAAPYCTESSPCRPDHRADSTPGMPFNASTSSPESSATVATPEARYASRALANAFSSNVAPVSGASSNAATSSNDNSVNDTPAPSSTRRNSASFLRLRLATSRSVNGHSQTIAVRRV